MVTVVVLINVERGRVNEVAGQLAGLAGVAEVYSVSGPHDLVAMIRVKSNEEMAELVTHQMHKVNGILRTETLIAFRAFSRHDLEGLFDLGLG